MIEATRKNPRKKSLKFTQKTLTIKKQIIEMSPNVHFLLNLLFIQYLLNIQYSSFIALSKDLLACLQSQYLNSMLQVLRKIPEKNL